MVAVWSCRCTPRVGFNAGRSLAFSSRRLRAIPLRLVSGCFPSAILVRRPPVGHAPSPVRHGNWGASLRVSCPVWLCGWFRSFFHGPPRGWLRVDDDRRRSIAGAAIVVGMRTFTAPCPIVQLHLLAVRLPAAVSQQQRKEIGSKCRGLQLAVQPFVLRHQNSGVATKRVGQVRRLR